MELKNSRKVFIENLKKMNQDVLKIVENDTMYILQLEEDRERIKALENENEQLKAELEELKKQKSKKENKEKKIIKCQCCEELKAELEEVKKQLKNKVVEEIKEVEEVEEIKEVEEDIKIKEINVKKENKREKPKCFECWGEKKQSKDWEWEDKDDCPKGELRCGWHKDCLYGRCFWQEPKKAAKYYRDNKLTCILRTDEENHSFKEQCVRSHEWDKKYNELEQIESRKEKARLTTEWNEQLKIERDEEDIQRRIDEYEKHCRYKK